MQAEATRAAVEVDGLEKRYPKREVNAVDGVSFEVDPGEIFGLLGPNGAGKTTTIGVLTTRVRATGGTATVAGVDVISDPVGARARLAVVPQRQNLDRSLTVRQNLTFHGAYHGVERGTHEERADALLAQFGLGERSGDLVDFFSGGQAQQVMIARALMHAPEVLFLDEPTTGLDPQARLFVWDRVRELRASGVTVVLTTQNLDEAEALADRVGIMDTGRLLALDTPAALTARLPGSAMLEVTVAEEADPQGLIDELGAMAGIERVEQVEQVEVAGAAPAGAAASGSAPTSTPVATRAGAAVPLTVRLYLTGQAALLVAPVNALLERRGARLAGVKVAEPSLEDVFIDLTGRALR